MKKRMQITISEKIKKQMDDAKDFYGGYSGLIEKAVTEFLSRPVEPYDADIKDIEEAREADEWIDIITLRNKLQKQ
ncbi:MAG: hypothetical protein AMS17_03620 [Spirochaetes bacterium DG_61]|nr:MAG: hypothetical protein AMS17_03620 [Spirochaetes bacterium DG_61]